MVPPVDFESLSLTEMIRLKDDLSQSLQRRFGRTVCLGFTDVVGSTDYFARFGDEAGRILQQRHLDALSEVLEAGKGRIVDTAGDGAFTCWQTVDGAIHSLLQMLNILSKQNVTRAREHQIELRCGLHWGPVLTDGILVTGDAVNLSARVAGAARPGQILMTREAFQELPNDQRVKCRNLPAVTLKGIPKPVDLVHFQWRDTARAPKKVRLEETGEEIFLPHQDTISFGRLREKDGYVANDIVLSLPDAAATKQISRWHFELRRHGDEFVLRPVSDGETLVDGEPVTKGAEVPVRRGTIVRVARVLTLTFLAETTLASPSGETTIHE